MSVLIAQNDYGFSLRFSLQNYDGTAFDLTDATDVVLYAQLRNSEENKITEELDVVGDPEDGVVDFTVLEKNFDQEGEYLAEIAVTFADRRETFTNIILKVVKNIIRD